MRKLNLRELQLTIPSITMLDARKLMGGDGYIDDDGNWHLGELDPAEVTAPYPDHDEEDMYEPNEEDDYGPDQGGPGGDGNNGGSGSGYSPIANAFAIVRSMSSSTVYNFIGGNVAYNYNHFSDDFANSCAIKLSYALNMAGHTIPAISGETLTSDIDGDGSNEYYIYRVSAMIPFLDGNFGTGERLSIGELGTLNGREGIIAFGDCNFSDATGHVALWDGERVVGSSFDDRCASIIFWDLSQNDGPDDFDLPNQYTDEM
jgi:hypothetical protein